MDKSSSLGMPMSPQEISKKYNSQSLGMPPRHPFFNGKNQVTFQDTILLLLHALCVFLGASVVFAFSFFFVCFNKWLDHIMFVLERDALHFSFAKNTLVFTLIVQRVFSFSRTAFSFHFFAMIYVQILFYLCIKVYLDHSSMLVFIKRVFSKRFEWCWKREKVSCKKVVQKGACLDCGLDFCMPCLMSF
jgi:hypothetical protein